MISRRLALALPVAIAAHPAMAQSGLTCDQISAIAAAGTPVSTVLDTVWGSGGRPTDDLITCLSSKGVPPEIVQAIRTRRDAEVAAEQAETEALNNAIAERMDAQARVEAVFAKAVGALAKPGWDAGYVAAWVEGCAVSGNASTIELLEAQIGYCACVVTKAQATMTFTDFKVAELNLQLGHPPAEAFLRAAAACQ